MVPVDNAVEIRGLDFRYPSDDRQVLRGVDLDVPRGARCLLLGANGAGKTTLLHCCAGRHMAADGAVRVLGRPAFSDTALAGRIAFLGGAFPLDVDISVAEMLARRDGLDPARRDRLLRVLDVDPAWRMARVSDGQRRRVQILLALLAPRELLLLDEVTTDLDVIARADLLQLLREESERGCALLYATHILDGLDAWATHLALLAGGRIVRMQRIEEVEELAAVRREGVASPLLRVVEKWLRAGSDRAAR